MSERVTEQMAQTRLSLSGGPGSCSPRPAAALRGGGEGGWSERRENGKKESLKRSKDPDSFLKHRTHLRRPLQRVNTVFSGAHCSSLLGERTPKQVLLCSGACTGLILLLLLKNEWY